MVTAEKDPQYENVRRLLLNIGASPKYTGFGYAACAIRLSLAEWPRLPSLTKELYPEIARQYHASSGSVDRNIRTLISAVWRKDTGTLHNITGYSLPERPTAGEFIAILTEYLSLR